MAGERAALLLDEDVWPGLAKALREQSLDAISVHEIGRTGLADEEQMAFAADNGRAILTHNSADFVTLAARYFQQEKPHSGVIIAQHHSKGDLIRRTLALLSSLSAVQLGNTIRWV